MIDYNAIICNYYATDSKLHNILTTHSNLVANKAVAIAQQSHMVVDIGFIIEAAMLHDIGIYKTQAPSILCNGSERYITHGIIGRNMLDEIGLPTHALVCERHTGAGITCNEIIAQNLPLPHRDMLPISIEEKIICYADKFFSKSDLLREKSVSEIRTEMARFGEDSLARFNALHTLLKTNN